MAVQKPKLLYGDELIAKQKECELKGFQETASVVLQKLLDGKIEEIHRCEVMYLLEKLR